MDLKKYPYNLIAAILESSENLEQFEKNCPEYPEKILEHLFNFIDSRQKNILLMYYRDGMTYAKIAEKLEISVTRVSQICMKAICELKFRRGINLLIFGLKDEMKEENLQYASDLQLLSQTKLTSQQKNAIAGVRLESLMISSNIIKNLKHKNMDTVAEVVAYGLKKNRMKNVPYLGKTGFEEVKGFILERYGIEILW